MTDRVSRLRVIAVIFIFAAVIGPAAISAQSGTSTTAITPTPHATLLAAGSARTDTLGIAQVWVPAGCFNMGSDPSKDPQARQDEQPAHDVCITHGFWLDQFIVTNAAFDAFVEAGGYRTDSYWSAEGLKWKRAAGVTGPDTSCRTLSSKAQQPRVCVKWYEAQAYANWRSRAANDGMVYRLPTEAEWEYAARGPQSLIYPWGNQFDGTRLNFCDRNCPDPWADMNVDDSYAYTSPVGAFENGTSWVNAYDMAGNAWQWVTDWYSDSYYRNSPRNDPSGPAKGIIQVVRGGAWDSPQYSVRAAFRNNLDTFRDLDIGFRLVAVPQAK